MKPVSLLVLAAALFAGAASAALAPTPYDVTITLSEKAAAELTKTKETITVSATFVGQKKAPKPDEDPEVMLGEETAELPGAGTVTLGKLGVSDEDVATTANLQILINVFSSRKASEDNILDCGIWQVDAAKAPAAKITIDCKLIGEE